MAECLVTGGGGGIGSHVAQALVGEGRSVRILDNFSSGRHENLREIIDDVEVVEGDLRDCATVSKAIQGIQTVFHLAALPSVMRSIEDPLSTHEVNSTGTLLLLREAHQAGVERLIFSSSSSVYGNTPLLPKQEDMKPVPLSPYAESKLAGEHYAHIFYKVYGLITFALRYFNVFGPRQNPASDYASVIPRFIAALCKDESPVIYGDGGQTRDFTFVEDVIRANLACCSAPVSAAGKPYNVAWGNRISIKDLAGKIAGIMGKKIEPIYEGARPGDVRDSQADPSRAKEQLGWTPRVTLEEGLERTIDWFVA